VLCKAICTIYRLYTPQKYNKIFAKKKKKIDYLFTFYQHLEIQHIFSQNQYFQNIDYQVFMKKRGFALLFGGGAGRGAARKRRDLIICGLRKQTRRASQNNQ
jgi:hypothetical protein